MNNHLTVVKNMTYKEALEALDKGQRVKLPEWEGFWFKQDGKHLVKLKSGEVVDTPWNDERVTERTDFEITKMWQTHEEEINVDLGIVKDLATLAQMVSQSHPSRERSIALTKIQEASLWLEMDMGRLNSIKPQKVDTAEETPKKKIELSADVL